MSEKAKLIFKKSYPEGDFTVWNDRPSFSLLKVNQCHSADIIEVNSELAKKPDDLAAIKADGLWESLSKNSLAIVTADCLPVLFIGKKGVAMLHAGWRGLHQKILLHPDLKKIAPHSAYIGPHISQKNYQVGPEFWEYFKDYPEALDLNKKTFSLAKVAKAQLSHLQVEISPLCTFDHPDLHSYRLNQTGQRNWNVWIPR